MFSLNFLLRTIEAKKVLPLHLGSFCLAFCLCNVHRDINYAILQSKPETLIRVKRCAYPIIIIYINAFQWSFFRVQNHFRVGTVRRWFWPTMNRSLKLVIKCRQTSLARFNWMVWIQNTDTPLEGHRRLNAKEENGKRKTRRNRGAAASGLALWNAILSKVEKSKPSAPPHINHTVTKLVKPDQWVSWRDSRSVTSFSNLPKRKVPTSFWLLKLLKVLCFANSILTH